MFRCLVLLWFVLAGAAHSQVVTVRAGQQDGVYRLVLTLPEATGWELGRTGDGYGFRVPFADWRYDLSTVFDAIPRERLAALWVDPYSGTLRLAPGCDCHLLATAFRPGVLILDILDGPPPTASPFELELADAGRPLPPLVVRKTLRPRARPAGLAPDAESPSVPLVVEPAMARPSLPPIVVPQPDPRASQLRDRLLMDLSRSIAAGAVQRAAGGGSVMAETRVDPSPPAPPETVRPNQMEIRQAGAPLGVTTTAQGKACVGDDRLDVSAWGNDSSAAVQFAQAQANLLGEFDRPDRDRVIALTRLNLFFGFGAEARLLLRLLHPDDPDMPLLDALGKLVDGATESTIFPGMQGCDTAAAMWSFLGSQDDPTPHGANREAIVRSFSALPLHLRRHLGIRLSDRFLESGDREAARAIRDAIDRATGPHGSGLVLIDAGLDFAEGRAESAEQKLGSVVADDGAAAARALAILIDSRLRRGELPDPAQVLALEAMYREHRTTAEGPTLRRSLAKGQVVTGEADRAFRELAHDDPDLQAVLWPLLAEHGEAIKLAELALDPAIAKPSTLPDEARLSVARRLQQIGFAEGARQWAQGLQSAEAAMLMAAVALDLRDGREALRHVAGLESAEANAIRARALALIGDYPGASLAWESAGAKDLAERARLLAQDWDALGSSADTELQTVIGRRAATPFAEDEAPLARSRTLLTNSEATRAEIDALLRKRQLPGI